MGENKNDTDKLEILTEIDELYDKFVSEDDSNIKKRTISQRSSNSDDTETDLKKPVKKQVTEFAMIKMPLDSAPQHEWNKFMCQQLMNIDTRIRDLIKTSEFSNEQSKQAIDLANHLTKELNDVQKDLNSERCQNNKLLNEVSDLREHVLNLECRQRRENIIFDGFPESRGETDYDCYAKVVDAISYIQAFGPLAEQVKISRCHRFGQFTKVNTRGIICHMHWFGDRSIILDKRQELPEGITVREDFPAEIEQRRNQLYPILKAARANLKYKGKCKMTVDKLVIHGRAYTTQDMDNLPEDLNPIKVCEKSNDSALVFFGQNHPLSNFYQSEFTADNITYKNAEQLIQSKKCEIFNDDIGHSRVMRSKNSHEIRKIGSRVKNFSTQVWVKEAPKIVFNALLAKFGQNAKLKELLATTGDRTLGECTRDKVWGVGCVLHDSHALDQTVWTGENAMGKILMQVRQWLKT